MFMSLLMFMTVLMFTTVLLFMTLHFHDTSCSSQDDFDVLTSSQQVDAIFMTRRGLAVHSPWTRFLVPAFLDPFSCCADL